MHVPSWSDPQDLPDPLSAPLSGHDTTPAPPNAEELAYQRRLDEIGQGATVETLRADCAAQFNAWMARKAQRSDAVGEHFRDVSARLGPFAAFDVTYLVDGGLCYAYIGVGGVDDVTSGTGEDSELAAYARFAAYLETDGVKS